MSFEILAKRQCQTCTLKYLYPVVNSVFDIKKMKICLQNVFTGERIDFSFMKGAADFLGISSDTLRRHLKKGTLLKKV